MFRAERLLTCLLSLVRSAIHRLSGWPSSDTRKGADLNKVNNLRNRLENVEFSLIWLKQFPVTAVKIPCYSPRQNSLEIHILRAFPSQ
jgi:hypothetical protein